MSTSTGASNRSRMMRVRQVKVGKRLRSLDPAHVAELAESMRDIGLQNPITVTEAGRLIAGRHRLEAAKRLGWKEIPVTVVKLSPVEAELAEIDENLIRNELSVLERGEHLVRRKQLHEQLHPESKQGGAPGKKGGGKAKTTESVGFVKNTATTMGRGEVTVREEVRIGNLPQQVRNLARGTLLANQKGRLLSLAKLKGKEQMAEARRLARGKPKRAVRKAKSEEATTVETPAVTVEPTVSTTPAMQPSTAAPIESTEPSSAREGKDALRARRKLAELLDVSGYPPAEQAAKMLAKVVPLLQVAIGRAPEMNRSHLESILQTVQHCAGLLEEHHVLRQSCSCNGSPDCTWCGGKGWLSWADQRRLSGQAQGVA